jgi:hypothetical protein
LREGEGAHTTGLELAPIGVFDDAVHIVGQRRDVET